MTISTTPLPNLPLPPGAMYAEPWEPVGGGDIRQCRIVNGATRTIEGYGDLFEVWTGATQYDDGTLEDSALDRPCVWLVDRQDGLSSQQARALAAMLTAAADELDGWTAR